MSDISGDAFEKSSNSNPGNAERHGECNGEWRAAIFQLNRIQKLLSCHPSLAYAAVRRQTSLSQSQKLRMFPTVSAGLISVSGTRTPVAFRTECRILHHGVKHQYAASLWQNKYTINICYFTMDYRWNLRKITWFEYSIVITSHLYTPPYE